MLSNEYYCLMLEDCYAKTHSFVRALGRYNLLVNKIALDIVYYADNGP